MLYIRIEMWPQGDRKSARLLHEGLVANVGGTETEGEYDALLSKSGGFKGDAAGHPRMEAKGVLRQAHVSGFKRLREGPWQLLALVLRAAFHDD